MNQFGDAIDFIFNSRETNEGVEVGGSQFLELAIDHMWLSLVAVVIACATAIPLGLWLGHIGRGGFIAINASNVGRAVPSLALIAFFVAYLGVGFANVTLALVLLAVPPILTNTYVGRPAGGPGHRRRGARHGDDRRADRPAGRAAACAAAHLRRDSDVRRERGRNRNARAAGGLSFTGRPDHQRKHLWRRRTARRGHPRSLPGCGD